MQFSVVMQFIAMTILAILKLNITTFANSDHLCDWINDGWCDENCRKSDECFGDFDDCNCNNTYAESNCEQLYNAFTLLMTDTETEIYNGIIEETVSLDGFCSTWDFVFGIFESYESGITTIGDEFETWQTQNKSCQWLFNHTDLNIHELIYIARDALALSQSKAAQINCTSCM